MAKFVTIAGLLLSSSLAMAQEVPARFGVSKSTVTVRLREAPAGRVVLRALGRAWTEPAAVREMQLEVELPTVRVPIAFDVVGVDAPGKSLARVVAYPPMTRLMWDEKVPLFVDAESPAWLREWLTAVGLPAKVVKLGPAGVPSENGGLLIAGRAGAADSAAEFAERVRTWGVNILVVEASWFGEPMADEARIGDMPDQFGHGLSALTGSTWPQSARFRGIAGPWDGIANRWVWIDGPASPLVERVAVRGSVQAVFSYVPWWQQLGVETADAVFLSVLKEASRKAAAPQLGREFTIVWPRGETVTAKSRPVLSAGLRERQEMTEVRDGEPRPPLSILDLRGPDLSSEESAALPMLTDEKDWIVLGRDPGVVVPPKPTETKDRIVRLEDDTLPPTKRAQVRLMQALTNQGVSLGKFPGPRREP